MLCCARRTWIILGFISMINWIWFSYQFWLISMRFFTFCKSVGLIMKKSVLRCDSIVMRRWLDDILRNISVYRFDGILSVRATFYCSFTLVIDVEMLVPMSWLILYLKTWYIGHIIFLSFWTGLFVELTFIMNFALLFWLPFLWNEILCWEQFSFQERLFVKHLWCCLSLPYFFLLIFWHPSDF